MLNSDIIIENIIIKLILAFWLAINELILIKYKYL